MQSINFGRIENLTVKEGQPVCEPAPRVVQEIKFAGENGPRSELAAQDFVLKMQVIELLNYISYVKNGTIDCLLVKHGLPFSMNVAAAA